MNRHRRRTQDVGSTSVELAVTVPVLLLLITSIIQFGLWYHASHVAKAAAQEGVRSARIEGGTAADGQARAERFLAASAPTLLADVQLDATRNGATARIEITGQVHSIIPGLQLPIRAVAESPVEVFRPATNEP